MPRKKGLGRAVEKSLDEMGQLIKDLVKFDDKTCDNVLKKTVSSASIDENDKKELLKMLNEASAAAHSLKINIGDIREKISELKPKAMGQSRFAKNVVTRFLNSD